MSIRWYSVVVDCEDVEAQSRWWATALDWRLVHSSATEAILVPPHALDRTRDIPAAEIRRLEALGARRADVGQDDSAATWVVMADPEGNEFCVLSARD